jgi:hypothetical protein
MTKIPSIEKTEDFIYRIEIKRGAPLHNPDGPHLLAFEQFIGPGGGAFHSVDVTILRDRQRVNDIDFYSFEHIRQCDITYVKFTFYDHAHCVTDHDYLLTVILRYLI